MAFLIKKDPFGFFIVFFVMFTQNKTLFDMIAMTPRVTLGLCCVYIAQLITHTAIYALPFTLQLCYKPVGILQRVTKSQMFIYQVMINFIPGQKIIFCMRLLDFY